MRSRNRGVSNFTGSVIKSALRILIQKFGIELVNEKIAEIFYEEAECLHNYDYDELSEAYDNINKKIMLKKYHLTSR